MNEIVLNWFRPLYLPIWDPINALNGKLKITNDFVRSSIEIKEETLFDKGFMDVDLAKFYSFFETWKLTWKTTEELNIKAEGVIDFIPLDQVMQDVWDNSLGGIDWNPEMKGFRPLDMFYDIDGFVGFYIDRPEKKGLYLQHSDSSVSPLHVDLDGYLKLLGMSKGFGWWQNALVEIHSGNPMPNVAGFKEKMPLIFPDFSWDAFVALYEEVRIDK